MRRMGSYFVSLIWLGKRKCRHTERERGLEEGERLR